MNEQERMRILSGNDIILNEIKGDYRVFKNLEAIEIIDKYDYLQKAFKYIITKSKSNHSPYHNLNHLLTVLKYSYQGAKSEKLTSRKEFRELMIAAIFHDVDHSAGKKKDDVNVENSKKAINEFITKEKIDVDIDNINKLLDATQYPYVIEGKDLNLSQSIIRDADLMQVYEYNWIQQNIAGLSEELNLDFISFLGSQRKFLENCEFNTSWGKKMKKDNWSNVMRQFKMLENACNVEIKK